MKSAAMVLILLLFSQLLFAQGNKQRIAVLRLQVSGISEEEGAILTDRLINELFATNKFTVLEREKMEEILNEQAFQLSGCTSTECMVEVGKLVGVREIVGGSVGKFGAIYTINIRMIDVETGAMIKQASFDYKGDMEALLTMGMKKVAAKLAGLPEPSGTAENQPEEIRMGAVPPKKTLPFKINFIFTTGFYSVDVGKLSDDLAARGIILKNSSYSNPGAKFQINAYFPELRTSFYYSNFFALAFFQKESSIHDKFSEQIDRSWPNANIFGIDIHPWNHFSFGLGYTMLKIKFNINDIVGGGEYIKDVKGLFYDAKFYVFSYASPFQLGVEFHYVNQDKVELQFIGLFFKKNFN